MRNTRSTAIHGSKWIVTFCLVAATLAGCGSSPDSEARPVAADKEWAAQQEAVKRFASYLTGSFSSEAQAAEDSDFLPITLESTRIWPSRTDGIWLYVEQALKGKSPYRQRVYKVSANTLESFRSDIYTLPDPETFVGAGEQPSLFDGLSVEELALREGCAVIVSYDPNSDTFAGSTNRQDCTSVFRGAAYATSEVTVGPNRLRSWDRGFDDNGKHIWGSEKGPYVFDRLDPSMSEQ